MNRFLVRKNERQKDGLYFNLRKGEGGEGKRERRKLFFMEKGQIAGKENGWSGFCRISGDKVIFREGIL